MCRLAREKTYEHRAGDAARSHEGAPDRLGAQQTSARTPDSSDLRALRCAAAGSTGALGFAAIRARSQGRIRLRPRRDGQQGSNSFAHHRYPGDDRTKFRPAGEFASGDRRRGRNWQRSPRRFSGGKSRCTEKRRGGSFRYGNDRAPDANSQLRLARRNGSRNQGHWSENGFAFGRLRWRHCESDHCARAIIGHPSRSRRPGGHRGILRSGQATRRLGA